MSCCERTDGGGGSVRRTGVSQTVGADFVTAKEVRNSSRCYACWIKKRRKNCLDESAMIRGGKKIARRHGRQVGD